MDTTKRQEMKDKLASAIRKGKCRCQMCKARESPRKLPPDWSWARLPTPEMHRNGRPGSALGWPTWIIQRVKI